MRKVIILAVATTALFSSTFTPSASAASNPKAGATCTKVGKTAIYKGKKFTCVKSGKKLVWNKGVVIPKLVATPSPIATKPASQSPSVTPLPSVSPSATVTASPSASSAPSASTTTSPPPSPKTSETPSASPTPSTTPTTPASASPSPSNSSAASPSASATSKAEPAAAPHAGTVEDPQLFNTFLAKNGIKVKVNKVTDNVSELVCKSELIHDGCDFGGAVDADSESRFIEIVITVVNNGTETWIPAIFGLYKDDEYFGGDFIVDGDIPGVLELEVGQSVTLNSYIALPNDIDFKNCLFFISESSSEEAFYIEVK